MEPTGSGGRASKKKLAIKQRRIGAMELKIQGYSYRQIADLMRQKHGTAAVGNYSQSQAYKDIAHELKLLDDKSKDTARQLVQISHARIEEMIAALYPYATGTRKEVMGDEGPEIIDILPDRQTVETILKAIDRQAKLHGLDKMQLMHTDLHGRPLGTPGAQFAAMPDEDLAMIIANLSASAVEPVENIEIDEDADAVTA